MGTFRGTKNCIVCNKPLESKGVDLAPGHFWMGHVHTKTGEIQAGFCGEDCQMRAWVKRDMKKVCHSGCYGDRGDKYD